MRTILTILLLLLTFSLSAFAQESSQFQVIVNSQNPVESLDRQFVSDTFLKKIKHWEDDSAIQPVDLRPDFPVRKQFSEDIMDRSVMAVKNYWEQLIFSGTDVPPPELKDEQDVIRYVSKHRNAIGYVSSSALAGATGVKSITIR